MGSKMEMQRFHDGTGSDRVKGSFHSGFSFGFGGTFYGSRLSALILQHIFALLVIYSYLRQSHVPVTAAVTRGISS